MPLKNITGPTRKCHPPDIGGSAPWRVNPGWSESRAVMLVVFNPAAGLRRTELLWRVLDVMVESGARVELAETRGRGHATTLARAAAAQGRGLVVAAGGDGTVAEVARGLLGSSTRLGVIPLGTANVLAHEFALPFAPRAVAAALAFGRTRLLWPGLARRPDAAAQAEPTLFVQMLGAGFDAQVVHAMPAALKRALGRSAYVVQGLRELCRYRFVPIRITVDGAAMEVGSVIVSKGRLYGGAWRLAPQARPEQRGFTVALFDRSGPFSALAYGAALPLDLLPSMPGLRLLSAAEVTIAGERVPAQADGDPAGEGPLRVTDSPCPIEVVVG